MEENLGETTFAMFDAECTDTDIGVRLNAMKKLSTVASALGVQRSINELVPYLDVMTERIYDDDEILLILAEQLRTFLPFVGGERNAILVINLLEKLMAIDETLVRDQAVESLKSIAINLDKEDMEHLIAPLILRLATSEWFTTKLAAVDLFSVCYPLTSQDIRNDLRHIYRLLCQDEVPLVRRASAFKFSSFADVLEIEYILNEFLPVFNNFSKDDQDSVKVYSVNVGISIAEQLKPKEIEDFIIPTLSELSCDSSWKVRYQTAYKINAIQMAVGRELTEKYLVPIYKKLIHDPEPQVREASAKNIVSFCEILHNTYNHIEKSSNEGTDPFIVDKILPLIQDLNNDCSSDVKEALAAVLASLCSVLGRENTQTLLLPIITDSLLNDSSKVRESIISNLNNIISIIGITDITETILKIVTDLVNTSSNTVWRTRRNLIVTISYMATHTDKDYFDTHLKDLYIKLLSDPVYAVRQTASLILPLLIKSFGIQWALESIIPFISDFANNKYYLYRYVSMFCINELMTPTLTIKSEDETSLKYIEHIRKQFTNGISEELQTKSKALITRLSLLRKLLHKKLNQSWVQMALQKLEETDLTDDDIKIYAEDTIDMFLKDNNMDILNVSPRELSEEGGDVYLEGILYLSIYQFLPILKRLSNDPIYNVQIKASKSIFKIQRFHTMLELEINDPCLKIALDANITEENLASNKYKIKNSSEESNTSTDNKSETENSVEEITDESLIKEPSTNLEAS